ncbi:hypothetical protein OIU85_001591 [Salix viminalis]|uniref:Uncharacterized protein n=1 Tax=Salix viminalis TaxID=40686 RepID=A0A9Q0VM31_SALVM|nr:hypothetical protein OIU85_001591 [Salix viminalis]
MIRSTNAIFQWRRDVLAADEVFCTGTAVVATSVASASMPESAFTIFQNHDEYSCFVIYDGVWSVVVEGAVGVDLKLGPNRMVSLESDLVLERAERRRERERVVVFAGCCFLLP